MLASVRTLIRAHRSRLLTMAVLGAVSSASLLVMWDAAVGAAGGAPGAPAGNSGTVMVDGNDLSVPGNDPMVGCPFSIDWYGFDVGSRATTVTFVAQPPSGAFVPVTALSGAQAFTFTGSGPGNAL